MGTVLVGCYIGGAMLELVEVSDLGTVGLEIATAGVSLELVEVSDLGTVPPILD